MGEFPGVGTLGFLLLSALRRNFLYSLCPTTITEPGTRCGSMRDVVDSVDLPPLRSLERFRNPRRGEPEQPRRVSEGQPEAHEEAFAVLAIGHDLPPPAAAQDDVVQCPRGIQPCLSWHPRAGPPS